MLIFPVERTRKESVNAANRINIKGLHTSTCLLTQLLRFEVILVAVATRVWEYVTVLRELVVIPPILRLCSACAGLRVEEAKCCRR